MTTIPTLKIYRTHPNVEIPRFQTSGSACFDIAYQPHGKYHLEGYNRTNTKIKRNIDSSAGTVTIAPGERALVPTGLVLDIPEGYSVRIHPRSGVSLKSGITLVNCEAVIDSDYVDELFLLVQNRSEINFKLHPGDRLAQAELVKVEQYIMEETTVRPTQKTNRVGGLGSTGVSSSGNKIELVSGSKPVELKIDESSKTKGSNKKEKLVDIEVKV